MLISLLLVAAQPAAEPPAQARPLAIKTLELPELTVSASREPVAAALSGTAVTIIGPEVLRSLALPQVKDYLTLAPGVAVAQAGPMGSQTQVRIRGAESNHSITFIDGIEVNDPASSGDFRFETLLAGGIDRIEVLRGPQSALWGSQALGGVIAILTPATPRDGTALYGEAEGGGLGTWRAGAGGGIGGSRAGIAGSVSWLTSDGYNIAPGAGDRDGHDNLTLHLKASAEPTDTTNLALIARHTSSSSQFDDFDYGAGVPLDAPLATDSRQWALRGEGGFSLLAGRWTHLASLTWTDARNINLRAGAEQNRSTGGRTLARYQTSLNLGGGGTRHRLTLAAENDRERFANIDRDPSALANQRRSRSQTSLIGEYRLDAGSLLGGGVALRHDWNDAFADATTVRATLAVRPGAGLTAHGSVGTGVADPTFYDQFGFFPGFFVGNPALRPERSTGWDAGLGWSHGTTRIDVTWFEADLRDEIVSTFDSATFLAGVANASARSRRRGIEASLDATLLPGLTLAASYAWVDATQAQVAGAARVREVRRPPHSGSVTLAWRQTRFDIAASAAITGARQDTDFARFVTVRLPAYTLLTLSGAVHLTDRLDLTARLQNALDARQEDVFAYRGPGATLHAGLRFRL